MSLQTVLFNPPDLTRDVFHFGSASRALLPATGSSSTSSSRLTSPPDNSRGSWLEKMSQPEWEAYRAQRRSQYAADNPRTTPSEVPGGPNVLGLPEDESNIPFLIVRQPKPKQKEKELKAKPRSKKHNTASQSTDAVSPSTSELPLPIKESTIKTSTSRGETIYTPNRPASPILGERVQITFRTKGNLITNPDNGKSTSLSDRLLKVHDFFKQNRGVPYYNTEIAEVSRSDLRAYREKLESIGSKVLKQDKKGRYLYRE